MQHLTFDTLLTLLGQTIRWEATGKFRPHGGNARISGIVASHRPILSETIEGDMLSIATIDDKGRIFYDGAGSFITFEIVKP